MRWLSLEGAGKRIGTFLLIAFFGFFICAYPEETTYVLDAIVNGIAAVANTVAISISTFFRTLFA